MAITYECICVSKMVCYRVVAKYMAFSLDGSNNWIEKASYWPCQGGVYSEVLPIEDEDFAGATFKVENLYFRE